MRFVCAIPGQNPQASRLSPVLIADNKFKSRNSRRRRSADPEMEMRELTFPEAWRRHIQI